jgi:hypothetical protein
VYFKTQTAKASTSGALFVSNTMFESSASLADEMGRASAFSVANGVVVSACDEALDFF